MRQNLRLAGGFLGQDTLGKDAWREDGVRHACEDNRRDAHPSYLDRAQHDARSLETASIM